MRNPNLIRVGALLLLLVAVPVLADEIPDRPEDLEFSELKYDPPEAKDYFARTVAKVDS